jgi:hypothetical protein
MESLDTLRARAISAAETKLRERGFVTDDSGRWHGALDGGEHGSLEVSVQLTREFSDTLPEIFVDRNSLSRRIPHVEKSGKICLGPSTGVLLDASNPRGIIVESLELARKVLIDGLSGSNDGHFKEEFLAYWDANAEMGVSSICNPSGEGRAVQQVVLVHSKRSKELMVLVADDFVAAQTWASRAKWNISQRQDAFFISLTDTFIPPDFDQPLSTDQILDIFRGSTSAGTFEYLLRFALALAL